MFEAGGIMALPLRTEKSFRPRCARCPSWKKTPIEHTNLNPISTFARVAERHLDQGDPEVYGRVIEGGDPG